MLLANPMYIYTVLANPTQLQAAPSLKAPLLCTRYQPWCAKCEMLTKMTA